VVAGQVLDRVDLATLAEAVDPAVLAHVRLAAEGTRLGPQGHERRVDAGVVDPPRAAGVHVVRLHVEDELAGQVVELRLRELQRARRVADRARVADAGAGDVVTPGALVDLVDRPEADADRRRAAHEGPTRHAEPLAQLLRLLVLQRHDVELPLVGRCRQELAVGRGQDVDRQSLVEGGPAVEVSTNPVAHACTFSTEVTISFSRRL